MITPDVLRTVPLLSVLSDSELREIASSVADMHLIPDEWLLHEGETPAFFIMISGEIELSKTVAGNEQVIGKYQTGDYFGEVPLLMGSPAVASLRAITPVHVLRLDAVDFHNLMVRSEKIAATILQTMTKRVASLQRLSVETPVSQVLIVGHPADLECYDLRQFMSGNRILFRWLNPENENTAHLIPDSVKEGPYPAVVFADDSVVRLPSKREVADRLGLQTEPQKTTVYDVAIIGGGPAGLAAAVYGASEGLQTLMIEREAPGGQAGTSSRIENYLGFPSGLSGGELGARALMQAKRFGTEVVVARSVQKIITDGPVHQVVLDGGNTINARTIILATGVFWRTLAIPGAAALIGRGIYYGAARTEALGVRGKDVYLIGGGNSAGQSALFFADYARCVTLLIRASTIEQGMSQYLIYQLANKENIYIELDSSVVSVEGEQHLEAITIENAKTQKTQHFETDALFVFIGADAETEWMPDTIARDERGYVVTGVQAQTSGQWQLERDPYLLETSVPGIFAAGDVRHGSIKRVASGVGEGSMAIAFIHQYLAL